MRKIRTAPGGFTLLEVIIAIAIFGVTIAAITVVMRTGIRSWTVGHGMSEMLQTARIAQEVINRDLTNIVYRNESEYNKAFRDNIDKLSSRYDEDQIIDPTEDWRSRREQRRREREAERALEEQEEGKDKKGDDDNPWDVLSLSNVSAPLDLTFQGTDSGLLDRLSFTRAYRPAQPNEKDAWGLRRVEFYVKDKVLYRKESDAFGFAPGERAMLFYNDDMIHGRLAQFYMNNQTMKRMRDLNAEVRKTESLTSEQADWTGKELAPLQVDVEEPLCEGVEIFDISYGFFKEDQWHEVVDWNSGAQTYRDPEPEDDLDDDNDPNSQYEVDWDDPRDVYEKTIGRYNREPDNLPAYLAIQLGIKLPGGKGRMFSYTFFHSFSQAQETDIKFADEDESNSQRDYGRKSRKHRSLFREED